jgi:hypothetical protein
MFEDRKRDGHRSHSAADLGRCLADEEQPEVPLTEGADPVSKAHPRILNPRFNPREIEHPITMIVVAGQQSACK